MPENYTVRPGKEDQPPINFNDKANKEKDIIINTVPNAVAKKADFLLVYSAPSGILFSFTSIRIFFFT